MILAEKIETKVYVNQENFVSHIQQPPSWHSFRLSFVRELLMILHISLVVSRDLLEDRCTDYVTIITSLLCTDYVIIMHRLRHY